MKVPAKLRSEVVRRAGGRCEYCRLSQDGQEAVFHVDHIHLKSHGGQADLANLALACVSCSLRKGARLKARDPGTEQAVPVFHPREQIWQDHFRWAGNRVVGLTPIGRATVAALRMSREIALAIRAEEARLGRFRESAE